MGCRGRETLQNLCDQIPGDALLYSMFKIDADPIKCPIKGKNVINNKLFAENVNEDIMRVLYIHRFIFIHI